MRYTEEELYPNPTEEDLKDPVFEVIWQAIKGWDIQRYAGGFRSGAMGNDVMHILQALRRGLRGFSYDQKLQKAKENNTGRLSRESLEKVLARNPIHVQIRHAQDCLDGTLRAWDNLVRHAAPFPKVPVTPPGHTVSSDPPLPKRTDLACDCGAAKLGYGRGSQHSSWCAWRTV